MLKKQLWTSLSITLHRVLPSTSRLSVDSMHVKQFSTTIFSSCSFNSQEEPRVIAPRSQFIWNLEFPVKYFCSAPSEIIRPSCWNCDAVPQAGPFLFCESCRSVQPVDHSLDYFQIFALEKKFEIGDENLDIKYKDWQKKLHPDLVHSKSERERDYAAEQSARVIDAYRTLTNPLSRAIYILKLEGIDVDEEKTISDPELLAEILEIREAVEEAAGSHELNQIQAQIDEKLIHWSKSFASAFRSRKFEDALTAIQRMTYYKRVNEEIVKKL